MRYSVDQVPPPLVIGFDDTWNTKDRHGHLRVSQPCAGSDKYLFTFNSTSISVEYQKIFCYKYTPFKANRKNCLEIQSIMYRSKIVKSRPSATPSCDWI